MSRVLLFKYRLIGELELNATGETKRCKDVDRSLQMHSSLIRRLSQERELEVNIWSYTGRKLLHSIDTGHSANMFCSKFVPETSDELVVSGAGDAEVEVGNPNVVWSASEDGTLKQHDFQEGASCPPGGSYPMNVAIFWWR